MAATTDVACLEAPCATGIGYANGFAAGARPEPDALVCGAMDAVTSALKGLAGAPPRLMVVCDTEARHQALGGAAPRAWADVQAEIGDSIPCVGWLCERVSGYGRGVQPVDEHGSLVVAALGDPVAVLGDPVAVLGDPVAPDLAALAAAEGTTAA